MKLTRLPYRTLAIVRGTDPEAALRTVLTLAEEGLTAVEVSLTTADALDVIERARRSLGPQALLGAGTVRTAADARRAAEAGAAFLVSPGSDEPLESELPLLIGALTPSEVMRAVRLGASAVKLFPASIGGPGYLRALRDPFPQVPFLPVGGVDAELARAYLAAGAAAVGVGSPLVGDAANGGPLSELRARTARWRAELAEVAV
ncbi:bifunctional 4-hydroxy-2-oxoglutarate aldolase/2-dehydro-3-deoxy-phosphogluconate aldolase [Kitasatospora sp. NPDC002227]|uniref:bifunctional 4-hydroxy-2-oxoglutarate aldolase/2-dehydro-3-deoxy-phosphogluconate aldolase n=1 Tax=Kitasatospora sp. NPDC002227 TaxID=3154773 RepID=UPI0033219CFA